MQDVAAFLRVINALENVRQSDELLRANAGKSFIELLQSPGSLARAAKETDDAIRVLSEAGLHGGAVGHLGLSRLYAQLGGIFFFLADPLSRLASSELESARAQLIAVDGPGKPMANGGAK